MAVNTSTTFPPGTLMETEPWWPGLVVAVVSSLILLLFLVTLLVHHLPPFQKWLLPILVRIAPPDTNHQPAAPLTVPQTNLSPHPDSGSSLLHHHPFYSRSRPSRPSSLPCLPEEKLAYYPSVVAVAAAAATQAAQAAAMPHRPHSFYPPEEEEEDEEEELDEDLAVDDDDCATPQQQPPHHPPYPPQQRGRVQHKLNLALHSDGSEASNSSSSASAINDHPDRPAHHHHSKQHQQQQQQQQQPEQQSRRHHRSPNEVVLRQRQAANHRHHRDHQDLTLQQQAHKMNLDDRMVDEWTAQHHRSRPPSLLRQQSSSLAETDCDVSGSTSSPTSSISTVHLLDTVAESKQSDHVAIDIDQSSQSSSPLAANKFKSSRGLSRSLAALTATGLGRIRSMIHLDASNRAESMMDMTDMSSTFGESESVSGSVILPGSADNKAVIELGLVYNPSSGRLMVRLVELRQLTSAGRNSSVQLRLLLLPDRKQRCKSKMRFINDVGGTVPVMESFVFNRIEPAELNSTGLRLRLYSSERLRRERLLGEAFVGLASLTLDHQREQSVLVALETKNCPPFKKSLAALGRSTSSSSSRGDVSPTSIGPSDQWPPEMIPPRNGIPELLLGLAYNGTTGRLSVEILRAASLRSWTSNRTPDACVKVLLLTQTGQELGRAKTAPKKSSSDGAGGGGGGGPTWMETFAFQVTLFQLAEVTLLISVVNKRSLKRRELLGWISLGFDSSVEQQTEHWHEMREAGGEQICHWHALLPP